MNKYIFAQLLIFALGVGWSVIFFLGKYTLRTIHKKMDTGFDRINAIHEALKDSAQKRDRRIVRAIKSLSVSLSRQNHSCRKAFVTRQEFGAFAANINHKIDSIRELLIKVEEPSRK